MRNVRGLGHATAFRLLLCAAPVAAASFLTAPGAWGQSAADKATARQLATEAIKLYRAGKHAAALDKMQRAQSLFDAPIHLLYIARAQEKTKLLVDSAETYRKLIRSNLGPNAPQAFVQAVEDGRKELAALVPRLPSLKVDVEPANVSGLDVRIDGNKVSAAIVGVDRPANPGAHTIRVAAPGFKPIEKKVSLKERQKLAVPFKLEPDESGGGAVVPPPPGGETTPPDGQPPGDEGTKPPEGGPKKKPSAIGFMAGLRLGGAAPSGSVRNIGGTELPLGDLFKTGGGGEIHGGVRIAKYFTPLVYFGQYILGPGPEFDSIPKPGVEVTTTGRHTSAGLGVMIGTPRGQMGGFGEVGISFLHEFAATEAAAGQGLTCDLERTFSGNALRLGGGGNIPIGGDLLHLTPFAMVSIGVFSEEDSTQAGTTTACNELFTEDVLGPRDVLKGPIDGEDQTTHSVFLFGVGGDFLFGGDSTK